MPFTKRVLTATIYVLAKVYWTIHQRLVEIVQWIHFWILESFYVSGFDSACHFARNRISLLLVSSVDMLAPVSCLGDIRISIALSYTNNVYTLHRSLKLNIKLCVKMFVIHIHTNPVANMIYCNTYIGMLILPGSAKQNI